MDKLAQFKTAQQISLDDALLAEFEAESHNGTCPYTEQCDERRRRLPTYRQYQPCHWIVWRNVADCPIFQQNGGNDDYGN